ncbi:hypothetical protein A3A38_00165 [Candidatus Kaiserbacteria bacterium RIFCSPLOWO2_01_FULL_53_17]|uniref:Uncharacterized protein n=1 Tax=Candidatus Kaiserbacteria bacterium RIFCSPLOWO2_01_FULL_53_17 TaxID=1798511 RepID=A0A1F6EH64_9BACT|nr:MAG: hypothetical protein A3A38_00165 [Candidatus Kaiserbacteria bacterium RIFCSPLOWO2_01_FULL_53_17]
MNKANGKDVSLREVLKEVRALRRDVSIVMPMESLEEYKNTKEITAAYRDARRQISRSKSA